MTTVLRILDANANRAREALRVMEEAARFILDDATLAQPIKELRHELSQRLATIPGLIQHRDTPGDVGTQINTPSELNRTGVAHVVTAACKRLTEALRTLEEYTKTLPTATEPLNLSQAFEAMRYQAYELEQRLDHALTGAKAKQWRLCVIISEALCPNGDWWQVAQAAINNGANCIQLREKSLDAAQFLQRAKQLVQLCKPKAVTVIINDRPDIALLSGADGVHLGQTDLPCVEARKLAGQQLLIGISTSSLNQAKDALADGADYCGVGPMFVTQTKHNDKIVGPEYATQHAAWAKLPHLAIGGITLDNIDQLIQARARGVAVCRAVCQAQNPGQVVKEFLNRLEHFA